MATSIKRFVGLPGASSSFAAFERPAAFAMALDPRWQEVFGPYALSTSRYFRVWTLSPEDAIAFQHKWNARVDATQSKRYVHDLDEGEYYGVGLDMCSRGNEPELLSLRLLREAVELLHTLAHVDLDLWRQVFTEAFSLKDWWRPHLVPVWQLLPYHLFARHVEVTNADVLYFFATLQQRPRSTTYYRSIALMWELLDLDPDRAMRLPHTLEIMLCLTPPASPGIEFVSREQFSQHLCAMAKALSALATCPRSAWMLPIHVVSTNVALYGIDVDAQGLRDLAALSAVTAIGSLQIHLEPMDNKHDSWTAFGMLLQHVALDRDTLDRRLIAVKLAGGILGRFVALCSAVRASRCVRSFNVEAEATTWPQEMWLRWLAWGWLGDGSNGGAELSATLTIERVTKDDVDVLRAVLTGGENPLSPFAPPLRWVTTTAAVATGSINKDSRAAITIPEGTRLAVIGDAPSRHQWVVLVPGFGVMYIGHDAATTSFQVWEPTDGSLMRSRVTALSLFVTGEQVAGLSGAVVLVELLGERLTELQLVMEQQELTQDHVAHIFRSCPQLRKVRISGVALSDLDVVIPFLNRPTAQLSQFVLIKLRTTQPSTLDGFVAALSTPSTHLAHQLAHVGLGLAESAVVESAAVDALYRMLGRNRRLKTLTVQFPKSIRPSASLADPPSHGECIARPARMVPLRQKLAFLSALDAKGFLLLAQVHATLKEVFAFAAEPTRRHVSVTFSNW